MSESNSSRLRRYDTLTTLTLLLVLLLTPHRCDAACDAPAAPDHGHAVGGRPATWSDDGTAVLRYEANSQLRYRCEFGYELAVDVQRKCMPRGRWKPAKTPQCLSAITCPDPGTPARTERVINGPHEVQLLEGATLNFKCAVLATLVGSEERACQANGTWSGEQPRCIAERKVDCRTTGADVITATGTPVRVHCPARHCRDSINDSYVCGTGIYAADSQVCAAAIHARKTHKGALLIVGNGAYSGFQPSTNNGISSVGGLHTTDSFRFLDDAEPDSSEPAAAAGAPPCVDPGVPPGAQRLMRGNHTLRFARGATLHYWCHYRESLTGSNQRTCLDDGTWSGYEPACEQRSELQTECTTTAAEVVGPAGVPVRVQCPPGCAAADDGVVYGTGIYRSDSHMCAAAVHAGKLSMAGGSVLVINNGRYSNFLRSKAHGTHSLAAVAAGDSFRFEGRVVPDSLTLQSASYGGAALGFAPSRAGVVACAAMAWFTTAARLAAVQ